MAVYQGSPSLAEPLDGVIHRLLWVYVYPYGTVFLQLPFQHLEQAFVIAIFGTQTARICYGNLRLSKRNINHSLLSSAMPTNYHIDLWEHASKLYRLSHWQQAADIFKFLGEHIANKRERTLCILNQALIEARLGDFEQAALTIADVAELGEDLPITAYIAGLVNCEMGQLILGEAWFEACLNGMNVRDIDYNDDRLEFVLEYATVQHNYESVGQARMAQELGYKDAAPDDLCYLPAELLFEAPPRSSEPSSATALNLPQSNVEANKGQAVDFRARNEEVTASSPTKASEQQVLESDEFHSKRKRSIISSGVPSPAYSVESVGSDSLAPLIRDELLDPPSRTPVDRDTHSPISNAPPTRAIQPRPIHKPIVVDLASSLKSPELPSPDTAKELRALERIRLRDAAAHAGETSPTYPRTKVPYTWHGRQKPNFEPRDARGVSDSTRELARFVHDYAPDGSYPIRKLMTRDATLDQDAAESLLSDGDAGKAHDEVPGLFHQCLPADGVDQLPKRQISTRSLHTRQDLKGSETAPSLQRSATVGSNRAAAGKSSRFRSMTTSGGDLGALKRRQELGRVRWPFEEDKEPDDEIVQQAQALARARTFAQAQAEKQKKQSLTAAGTALKPEPLDFIMGPDGKTRIIERKPKPTATTPQVFDSVDEGRFAMPGPSGKRSVTFSPDLPVPVHTAKPRELATEPPILQPTVYEPPTWRQIKASLLPLSKPEISAPLNSSAAHQESPSLSLFQHRQVNEAASSIRRKPVSPLALSRLSDANRISRSSAVSSVNMFDYILDKIKSDESKNARKK